MDKRLDAMLERITEQLNNLKKAKDFWSDQNKQAQYESLQEERNQLIQRMQFGNVM
jgi:hypothetical protein